MIWIARGFLLAGLVAVGLLLVFHLLGFPIDCTFWVCYTSSSPADFLPA